MSEIETRPCINCLKPFAEHTLNIGTGFPCPGDAPGTFYIAVFYYPATNLEYLERKADETIR